MSVAENIGTLWPLSFMVSWPMWAVAVFCFMATPGMMFLIYWFIEDRPVPWRKHEQFSSFLPGDFFLSAFVAYEIWIARQLEPGNGFYNATWWHVLVMSVATVVAVAMWWGGRSIYTMSQLRSPSKLYHDALFAWYAYLAITTFVAGLFAPVAIYHKLAAFAIVSVWIFFLISDGRASRELRLQRARLAHIGFYWKAFRSIPA